MKKRIRKTGEIFEYNGEWYQCVEEEKSCINCAFRGTHHIDICASEHKCLGHSSEDTPVIFKKLEKVGEPYEYFVQHKGIVMLQPYKLFTTPIINGVVCNVNYNTNTIDLEIKQNKEDMEEKKCELEKLLAAFVNSKITYAEYEKSVEEWYKNKYSKEEYKEENLTLKEFDLEAAKAGKPVCTRDGRKARIICFDRRLFYKNESYPILALVEYTNGIDDVCGYNEKGKARIRYGAEYKGDLMMLSEKKEGWVVIRRSDIYETEEQAKEVLLNSRVGVMIRKIEWEE